MQVKITKGFKFAREGLYVVEVEPGQIVTGRCAEVALNEKWGELFENPKVVRLPLLPEYLAAGYQEASYQKMLDEQTAAAKVAGAVVEIRERTEAEKADLTPREELPPAPLAPVADVPPVPAAVVENEHVDTSPPAPAAPAEASKKPKHKAR